MEETPRHPKKLNLGIISNFILFKKMTICVCQHIDLYIKRTKETQEQNFQLLLSFVKPHGLVSTPTISRWVMMVLSLSGIDTKTFAGHSTRTVSSSKAKAAGAPTRETLKCGFWSKESTFEKFYHKEITPEDPNFHKFVLGSFEERPSQQ